MAAKLYRVVGPTFVAGFLTSDTGLSIQDAAPIIRYFVGRSMVYAVDRCRVRGWKLEHVDSSEAGKLLVPEPGAPLRADP